MSALLVTTSPRGRRYCVKAAFVEAISDAAIDTLVAHFAAVPSPFSLIAFQQLGNAARRVPPGATAFYHRRAMYEWFVQAAWPDPADDARNIRWARAVAGAMLPFTPDGALCITGGRKRWRGWSSSAPRMDPTTTASWP